MYHNTLLDFIEHISKQYFSAEIKIIEDFNAGNIIFQIKESSDISLKTTVSLCTIDQEGKFIISELNSIRVRNSTDNTDYVSYSDFPEDSKENIAKFLKTIIYKESVQTGYINSFLTDNIIKIVWNLK